MTDTTDTWYSKDIPGSKDNWNLTARFDLHKNGCLGIAQWEGKDLKDVNRILLSKEQVTELRKFLEKFP